MIRIKSPAQLVSLDEANRIVHRVLEGLAELVAPGITTRELDAWAEAVIRAAGAEPVFLGYQGFPATLCTSRNDVVVHGIPDDRPLEAGDAVGIDCGVRYRGHVGDGARTYAVGAISAEAEDLLRTTREALDRAVATVRPGGRVSDIGHAVERRVDAAGYSVVRQFVGHGVGVALHEDPKVPNFGHPGQGARLRPGMVLAVEPMVNAGGPEVTTEGDGWTVRTADGTLSAHFEYSIAVTESGPWVLGFENGEPKHWGLEQRAA